MAAAPFGFSVGDFVAGIQLIHKAAEALQTASEATTQYQQAILSLKLIETVLRRVQGLTPTTANQETIRIVQLCGIVCHVPLDKFLRKLKKLEPHLIPGYTTQSTGTKKFIRAGRKLQWAFSLKEDVAKLQLSIGPGIEILNTLLHVESLERGEIAQRDLQQVCRELKRILPAVHDITSFMQSNLATHTQINGLHQVLQHLDKKVSQNATTHEVLSLFNASTNLSTQISNTATQSQADGLRNPIKDDMKEQKKEALELRELARQLYTMLVSLSSRLPAAAEIARPSSKETISGGTLQSQPPLPEKTRHTTDTVRVNYIQHLLGALRNGLNAIMLLILCFSPALRFCLRALTTISRSPSLLLDSNITFVDVLNREFSLQHAHFRYWPVVSAWLRCQFRDCPGSLHIARRRFAIFRDMPSSGRGVMIPPDEWEASVSPGLRVFMSMHYNRYQLDRQTEEYEAWESRKSRQTCPSCGFPAPRDHDLFPVWTKCTDCGLLFVRLDIVENNETRQERIWGYRFEEEKIDDERIAAFSRVHHFRKRLPPRDALFWLYD